MKVRFLLFVIIPAALIYYFTLPSKPEKKIATRVVMDSLYHQNKALLASVSREINALPEIKKTQKLIVKDLLENAEEEALSLAANYLKEDAFLEPSFKFSKQNSCIINNTNNLRDFGGVPSDSIIAVKKNSFDLAFLSNDDFYNFENNSIWEYHQDNKEMAYYHDSIYASETKQLIDKVNLFVKSIKTTKYLVYIADLYYLKPKMSGTNKFESGMLITSVEVYERTGKKKIGHKVLYVTNSDEVSAIPVPINDDEMKKKVYYKNIESNLAQNRNKAVEDFLEGKEVTSF